MELYSNSDNYAALTYENTLTMAEEVAPLVTPDEDDPKAIRFDALYRVLSSMLILGLVLIVPLSGVWEDVVAIPYALVLFATLFRVVYICVQTARGKEIGPRLSEPWKRRIEWLDGALTVVWSVVIFGVALYLIYASFFA